ncbi:MAG: ABC transporter permease [Candidatus Bipolaricaulota bacterium]
MRRRIVLVVLLGIFIGLTVWVTEMDSLKYMEPKTYSDISRQAWNHMKMVGIAELLAIGVGIPLGILVTRPGLENYATPIVGAANVGQTIPSLAVIAIMAPLLGYGFNSAIVALFVYSLLPVLRNSYTGIRDINPAIIESAKGMGMSRAQIAWRIELPLARPVIMAGIRTSTVICVGTATLAVLVGGEGLGKIILTGLYTQIPLLIVQGAAPTAALAVILDTVLGSFESLMTPRGLKKAQ